MSIITQPTDESKEAMQAKYQAVPPKTRSGGGGGDLPSGGTEGQVLTMGATDPEWADPASDLPEGGTEGQVLTMGATDPEWADPAGGLPTGGTEGQVLTMGATDPEWGDVPASPSNLAINIMINATSISSSITATSVIIKDTHNIIGSMVPGDAVPAHITVSNMNDNKYTTGIGMIKKFDTDYAINLFNVNYGAATYDIQCIATLSGNRWAGNVSFTLTRSIVGINDVSISGSVSALPSVGNIESISGVVISADIFDVIVFPVIENHYPFYMTWAVTPTGESEVLLGGITTMKFTNTNVTHPKLGTIVTQTIAVSGTSLYVIDAEFSRNISGATSLTSATLKRLV